MTTHPSATRTIAFTVIGALLLVAIGAVAASLYSPAPAVDDMGNEPGRVSVTGETICLPHKDTDGPHTLECAIGLQGDDGERYGLDLSAASMMFGLDTGMRISVEGRFVPADDISDEERMSVYDIVGLIRVVSVVEVENE